MRPAVSSSAARGQFGTVRRVLVWRQGSLGDTVVALPSLNLVARAFPDAERRLLTDAVTRAGIAPAAALVRDAGLIDGTIEYPGETRSPAALAALVRAIREFAPDVCVYLVEARSRRQRLRDRAFLALCGVRRVIGPGFADDTSTNRPEGDGLLEPEWRRLLRSVAALGTVDLADDASWDLRLGRDEIRAAQAALAPLGGAPYVAFSLGTKWQPNEYGDANWAAVLAAAGAALPGVGLVAVGAPHERERSEAAMARWRGPRLNLCGDLAVRESAAALGGALVFTGHDSGPMHLAAAMGVPAVAVFSGRNAPGVWYPRQNGNTIFYNDVACAPCGLTTCTVEGKRCILSIPPQDVAAAIVTTARAKFPMDDDRGAAAVRSAMPEAAQCE